MKDFRTTEKSRNARLNLARRQAEQLVYLLNPELRPKNDDVENWNDLFATIKDMAQDVYQGVHEASAYHNVLKDPAPDEE